VRRRTDPAATRCIFGSLLENPVKLHIVLTAIFAAALASGCASTKTPYDNNNANRQRFAWSSQPQALGSVASNNVDALRVGDRARIDPGR
jgi:PBP1b-binding outer membrane lipoprotein LpoB